MDKDSERISDLANAGTHRTGEPVFTWDPNVEFPVPRRRFKRAYRAWKRKLNAHWRFICPLSTYYRQVRELYNLTKSENSKSFREVLWDFHRLIFNERAPIESVISDYFTYKQHIKGSNIDDYVYWDDRAAWRDALDKWTSCHERAWFRKGEKMNFKGGNKDYMWHRFTESGIPTTRRFGTTEMQGGDFVVEPVEPSNVPHPSFMDLLRREKRLFCKPVDGWQGTGCMLIEWEGEAGKINGVAMTREEMRQKIRPQLVVEEVLSQHETLAALHPQSINTLRIATMTTCTGEPMVIAKCLRIGGGESTTDNWSSGGIVVGVRDDGTLKKTGYTKVLTHPGTDRHPDTGIVFDGYAIPYYKEALELVLHAHRCFNKFFSVGWDVAITPCGPILIECNLRYGIHTLQQADCGLRKIFLENLKPAALAMAQKDQLVYESLSKR